MADEAQKMEIMGEWLDTVATELDIDSAPFKDNRDELLKLTAQIAHGPTRPGAPMTLFLIGLAAENGADVSAMVAKVRDLLDRYED